MRAATQPRYRPVRSTDAADTDHVYKSLSGRDQDDTEEENLVPLKPIGLAVILLIIGSVLLTLGFLHLRGHIYSKDGAGWGLVTLGLLTFTPGFYVTRIAYHAWMRHPGFTYSAIPS